MTGVLGDEAPWILAFEQAVGPAGVAQMPLRGGYTLSRTT